MRDLYTKVTHDAYIFYEGLATFAAQEAPKSAIQAAIEQMITYVESVEACAEQTHLAGLQEICVLTKLHVAALETENKQRRQTILSYAEHWPQWIMHYLYEPTDESSYHALIDSLQVISQKTKVTDEKAKELTALLIQDGQLLEKQQEEETLATLVRQVDIAPPVAALHVTEDPEKLLDETVFENEEEDDSRPAIQLSSAPPTTEYHFTETVSPPTSSPIEKTATPASEWDKVLDEAAFDDSSEDNEPATLQDDAEEPPLIANTATLSAVEEEVSLAAMENDEPLTPSPAKEEDTQAEAEDTLLTTEEDEAAITEDSLTASEAIAKPVEGEKVPTTSKVAEAETSDTVPVVDLPLEEAIQVLNEAKTDVDVPADAPTNNTTLPAQPKTEAEELKPSKTVTDLSNKIVEISDTLSTALNQFVTLKEDDEQFLQAIEHYTNCIQFLWESAEKLGLRGFQEICAFITDNIFETSTFNRSKRLELREIFALWPKLVLDYLQAPTKGATILIEHLRNPAWPVPMLEEHLQILLVQLVQETVVPHITETYSTTKFNTNASVTARKPVVVEHPPVEKATQESSTASSAPAAALPAPSDTATETLALKAYDAVEHVPVNKPDWGEAFIEEDVHLANDKDEENFWLTPSWEEESSEEEPAENGQLSKFRSLLINAIQQTTAPPEEKPLPLAVPEKAQDQVETTVAPIKEAPAEVTPPAEETVSVELAAPEILDALAAEIMEAQRDLSLALSKLVTAEEDSDVLLEATVQYNDNVQAIWDAADAVGLEGLQAVCTLIKENVVALSTEDFVTRQKLLTELERWPQLTLNYLRDPLADADMLVTCLSQPAWPLALEAEQAKQLSAQLLESSLTPPTPEARQFGEDIESPAPLVTEETTTAEQNISIETDKAQEETPAETLIDESVDDSADAIGQEDTTASLPSEKPVEEPINEQINDSVIDLSVETPTTVTPVDDNAEDTQTNSEIKETIQTALDETDTQQEAMLPVDADTEVVEEIAQENEAAIADLEESIAECVDERADEIQIDSTVFDEADAPQAISEEYLDTLTITEEPTDDSLLPEVDDGSEQKIPTLATIDTVANNRPSEAISPLWHLLQDIAATLPPLLAQLVEAPVGSETAFTLIETYTEQVQTLWDAVEGTEQVGLQTVCNFINDNVMLLGGRDTPITPDECDVFAQWPHWLQLYLQEPAEEAAQLITALQEARWPAPLDEVQALTLMADLSGQEIAIEEEEVATSESLETRPDFEIAPPDTIALIVAQLQDVTPELTDNLAQICAAESADETVLTAVETYSEHVQAIWDVAEMASLAGLQTVCTFINDNVMLLSQSPPADKQVCQTILAAWPAQVETYLQQPAVGIPQLIEQLKDPRWPAPLDEAQAETLAAELAGKTATEIPEAVDTEAADIVLAAPDILALVIGQIEDAMPRLDTVLDSVCVAEIGTEAVLNAIEAYTEEVQAIWEAAEMAGLAGLQTVCTFINDNIMPLGEQPPAAKSAIQLVFVEWPSLTLAYLQQPLVALPALITHLQDARWPAPLEASAAAALQQQCLQTTEEIETLETTAEAVPAETGYLAAPEVIELIQNQITDIVEGLSAAFEICMSMENDNPALLEAVENYTNQVQAIWEAAEMAGLKGLQEVCTFVNDNLMAFAMQEQATRQAAQPYFEQWPTQILAYLQAPLAEAHHLVAFLSQADWPAPLSTETADDLTTLLTQPSQSPEQVVAYESETTAETVVESVEEEGVEETATELNLEVGAEEISLGNAEALEILSSELESAKDELAPLLEQIVTLPKEQATFTESIENYVDSIQRLNMAAEMLGLEGLQTVCTFIANNVNALGQQEVGVRSKAKAVLQAWPDLVLAYLHAPTTSVIPMLNHLREPQWPQPLPDEQAHALLNLLSQGSTVEETVEEAAAYARQSVANAEDVALAFPEDVNADLLQAYLQEAPQHASDFSAAIQNIIREPDSAEIERAQRIAHTLKGSSNILGIKGIANIAHHLEDTLEYLAQHKVVPPKALTDTMVDAADCIEMMVDALLGQDEPPEQALTVLQTVLDWANQIDKGKLDAPPIPTKPPPTATPAATPAPSSAAAPAVAPSKVASAPKAASEASATPEQALRVPTRTVDELMRLVGELSISVGQIQERLKHIINNTRSLSEHDVTLQQKIFELENLVDVRGLGVEKTYLETAMNKTAEEFDPLEFEEYNELHSVTHSFVESIADNRELTQSIRTDLLELESMFVHQERLNKEFQSCIMTTRMVPVNTIIAKLQRNVRQTCRTTGKQAELDIAGADILIDSDVLNNLADPLQHILRNAIDHGLETPEERTLLGKPESGTIQLRFYREGNNIVVSCQDDGQGLNYTNIRYTAIQRGLIREEQEMTEAELARLILMSGFSTKSGVTQVSGRGVGMDVVHTNIRQMKGTLDLMSETGKGMIISIKLPMTLVTVHVLVVRVGQQTFGIPTNTLTQVLAPGVGELQKLGEDITLKVDKNLYAIKSLGELLHVPSDISGIEEQEKRPIVLVREETTTTAVVVDELVDTHDLVMKNMGQYIKHVRGVAGAAILGDGSLVPLLDLPELLRSPIQAAMSSYLAEEATLGGDLAAQAPTVPYIMIVDDSLSVRKSLSILVEDAGFEPILAKDGLEAIEMMNQTRPSIMLVDMEMPRMNGLELTAHIRANRATEKLPILMITSRTTEKHREQARTAGVSAYLTKPYQDTELLDLIDKALAGQL